jgi:hypothetical protein
MGQRDLTEDSSTRLLPCDQHAGAPDPTRRWNDACAGPAPTKNKIAMTDDIPARFSAGPRDLRNIDLGLTSAPGIPSQQSFAANPTDIASATLQ